MYQISSPGTSSTGRKAAADQRRGRRARRRKSDRRPPPVVDQEVHPAVLVEVARQAAHRRHGPRVVGQRRGIEGEHGVAGAGARHRLHQHLVDPRVDRADVVRQAVAVEVVERHRRRRRRRSRSGCRGGSGAPAAPPRSRLPAGAWQRLAGEGEAGGEGVALGLRQRGQAGEAVEARDHRHRRQPRRVAAEEAGLRLAPSGQAPFLEIGPECAAARPRSAGSPGRSAGRASRVRSVTAPASPALSAADHPAAIAVCAVGLPARCARLGGEGDALGELREEGAGRPPRAPRSRPGSGRRRRRRRARRRPRGRAGAPPETRRSSAAGARRRPPRRTRGCGRAPGRTPRRA